MKTKILTITLFLITLTGCDKQAEPPTSEQSDNPTTTAQFEQSDEKIGKYLDQLDDPNTIQDARTQILCKDYPTEYKTNYMPSLMKLSLGEYTESKLLSDLESALDYYKSNFDIKC
ncbi:hypothetical protein E0H80_06420 [Acinetobacter sp. ANC 4779]|uniref:hypothetical protein n=1 Tax=Acinetobacter sp. ANC 4779 TaxID=2529848 RepID=UPI00103895F4|nr:hypothetical protein [Acinetobacter sp. ANC 4779]TCB50996.1 hypothetical protein E0H80_06420 [Acinetobacter sp. ANC 4779]